MSPNAAPHVVVPYGAVNSSVRVRVLHWIERLHRQSDPVADRIVMHGPDWPRSRVEAGQPVLLFRNKHRISRGRSESSLLDRSSLGVYELDDGLPWDDGRLPDLGRWWKRAFPRSLIAWRSAVSADRVIVGNPTLAEWASELCSDVRIIPTVIEPDEYRVRTDWSVGADGPLIGWIGSPATEHFLFDLVPVLIDLNRNLGARLEVISGQGELPAGIAPFATRVRWNERSVTRIADWDCGVMPLRDGLYERAKCGYKLLQYAASGVPAVGSPVGVNADLLGQMDGLAPTGLDDWYDAVAEVVTERTERRRQRAELGLALAQQYSYETWESAWRDAVGWC